MKKKGTEASLRFINVQVTAEQHTAVLQQFEMTTYRKMSEFIRDKLLSRPISVKVRHASADEFLVVAAAIKKELTHSRLLLAAIFEEESVKTEISPSMALDYLSTLKDQIKDVGDMMNKVYELISKK